MHCRRKKRVIKWIHKGGHYTNELKECIMHLLTLNVGIYNIIEVVECVLKLAGKKCFKLPSWSKINDLLVEARAISYLQVAEELTKLSSKDSTLHADGTTKFGHKYLGNKVITKKQSLTLGVREVVQSSGKAPHWMRWQPYFKNSSKVLAVRHALMIETKSYQTLKAQCLTEQVLSVPSMGY